MKKNNNQKEVNYKRHGARLWFTRNLNDLIIFFLGSLFFMFLILLATKGFSSSKSYNDSLVKFNFNILGQQAEIKWYAVFILSGVIISAFMGKEEFKRYNYSLDSMTTALLICLITSILSSRLYYAAFEVGTFKNFFDLRTGGLSIHGAFIGACITATILSKPLKYRALPILDAMVIGFLIGQIMGRWGNFMNKEAFGPVIENPNVIKLIPSFIRNHLGNVHPTFLYEGLFNSALLVALLIYRRLRVLRTGDSFCLYLIYYSIMRGFIIEPLRTDPLVINNVRFNEWPQAIIYCGVALIIFYLLRILHFTKVINLSYYYDISSFDMKVKKYENIFISLDVLESLNIFDKYYLTFLESTGYKLNIITDDINLAKKTLKEKKYYNIFNFITLNEFENLKDLKNNKNVLITTNFNLIKLNKLYTFYYSNQKNSFENEQKFLNEKDIKITFSFKNIKNNLFTLNKEII